jgi:hypothetical protein
MNNVFTATLTWIVVVMMLVMMMTMAVVVRKGVRYGEGLSQ